VGRKISASYAPTGLELLGFPHSTGWRPWLNSYAAAAGEEARVVSSKGSQRLRRTFAATPPTTANAASTAQLY
jgi:hypothetical protein